MNRAKCLVLTLACSWLLAAAPLAGAENYLGVGLPLGEVGAPTFEVQYHLDHLIALEGRLGPNGSEQEVRARLKYRLNLDGGISAGIVQSGKNQRPVPTIGIWGDTPLRDWRSLLYFGAEYAFAPDRSLESGRIGLRHSLQEYLYVGAGADVTGGRFAINVLFGIRY